MFNNSMLMIEMEKSCVLLTYIHSMRHRMYVLLFILYNLHEFQNYTQKSNDTIFDIKVLMSKYHISMKNEIGSLLFHLMCGLQTNIKEGHFTSKANEEQNATTN